MQNLEVKETIKTIRKTKSEIKKELEESIAISKRNENVDMQEKVNGCATNKDAVKAIQEFEQIIKNRKSNIIWLATIKVKYFKNLERNNVLSAWF